MNKTTKRFHDETGLTLLELMFAAGVMVIAFVLLFQAVFSLSSLRDDTEQRAIAMAHVSSIMEQIHNGTYEELLAYVPPEFPGLNQQTFEIRCYYPSGEFVTLPSETLTTPLPNPLEVQVLTTWQNYRGGLSSAEATTVHRR